MKLAGREVRVFDPFLLLAWSIPWAIGIAHMPPILPYVGSQYSRGTFGFPLAFGDVVGVSSGENVISLVPMAIDISLLLVLFHFVGLRLSAFRPAIGVAAVLAWLQVLFCVVFIWGYTWGLNWWALGAADYYIRHF